MIDFFDRFWNGFWYQKLIKIDKTLMKIAKLRSKKANISVRRLKMRPKGATGDIDPTRGGGQVLPEDQRSSTGS